MLFFGHCTIRYRAMPEEQSGADRYNKSMSIGRTSCLQMLSAITPTMTTTSVSKVHCVSLAQIGAYQSLLNPEIFYLKQIFAQ